MAPTPVAFFHANRNKKLIRFTSMQICEEPQRSDQKGHRHLHKNVSLHFHKDLWEIEIEFVQGTRLKNQISIG